MGSLQRVQAIVGPLPPGVARALDSVAPAGFLPPALGPLAGGDAPLPFFERDGAVAVTPSPRALALMMLLLDLEEGQRVLLVGAESGYLGALCAEAGAARVRIVEPDLAVARAAQGFLAGAGYADRVEARAGPPAREAQDARWDRALLLDPRRTVSPALGARLAELGFAVALQHTSQGFEAVKTLRAGEQLAEMRAPDLLLARGLPQGPGSFLAPPSRRTITGLLTIEEMGCNVWRGAAPTPAERALREGVEDTWRLPPERAEALAPAHRERRGLAQGAFHLGYLHQASGDLDNAADLYQRSLAVLPSAEGHTFLGWVWAFQGRLEEAMARCREAIAVDPTLGNPYNDLGAYLVQLGRPREAIPWLEKALQAPRYEAPFFPHMNLARVHLAAGDEARAKRHLRRALELNPGYAPAQQLLRRLEGAGAGR